MHCQSSKRRQLAGSKERMCSWIVEEQPDIGQVIEDNILTFLDTVGVKNADDVEDDKMSFIEAVYAFCIAGREPKAPTWRVHAAIFQLLDGNQSMVLNLASYSLLVGITQQYPHILVRKGASKDTENKVILNNKIWSPFRAELIVEDKGRSGVETRQANQAPKYCKDVFSLLEEIQIIFEEKPKETNSEDRTELFDQKVMGHILKFKYFFGILKHDFNCWLQVYKDVKKAEVMSNCYLIRLYEHESRKANLLKLLLGMISSMHDISKKFLDMREFSSYLQALIEMRISFELESERISNASPRRGRQSSPRSPSTIDHITEILDYNKGMVGELLEAMDNSDCKSRILFAYFITQIPKPLVKQKFSDPDNKTIQNLLNCFEDVNSVKSVLRTIESDKLQVILASAFKMGLRQGRCNELSVGLCKSFKTAFENLRSISSEFNELHPAAKQALITAEGLIVLANK